ncbi:MAG: hypothetical protein IJU84_01525 [Clostridia bacterium]|nr:hypothetical protein [Clostridia bacterium]
MRSGLLSFSAEEYRFFTGEPVQNDVVETRPSSKARGVFRHGATFRSWECLTNDAERSITERITSQFRLRKQSLKEQGSLWRKDEIDLSVIEVLRPKQKRSYLR